MKQHVTIVLAALLVAACGGGDAPDDEAAEATQPADTTPPPLTELSYAPALQVNFANMTMTPSGIYFQDVTTGGGAIAELGKLVTVEYRAWLPDGTLFEQRPSPEGFGASEFVLGVSSPVPGLTEGMNGMRSGGVRRIVIPAEHGYGMVGRPAGVPERSPLVFEIKLIKVADG